MVAAAAAMRFEWQWQGTRVSVGYEECGRGPTVLLLPSFSTVSTRAEMRPLASRLAAQQHCLLLDWPGFGDGAQPALRQTPALHLSFLEAFACALGGARPSVVAAGHAAGYALALARQRPGIFARIVLLAPTWRGPLPTMMGGYRPLQRRVRAALRAPLLGHALYRLNVTRALIALMYRRHVYADPAHVQPQLIRTKARLARQRGHRFGSAAFVTGALDPVRDRAAWLALASPPTAPTLLAYGPQTPPKSRAEMQALAQLPGLHVQLLPQGALALHEEYPDEVAACVAPFLARVTKLDA
jgi:pimeloyl-ACP methyl ester carboxylesterase